MLDAKTVEAVAKLGPTTVALLGLIFLMYYMEVDNSAEHRTMIGTITSASVANSQVASAVQDAAERHTAQFQEWTREQREHWRRQDDQNAQMLAVMRVECINTSNGSMDAIRACEGVGAR